MKKVSKVLALVLACVMVFSACQKAEENTPANSTTPSAPAQTTPAQKEESKTEEPKQEAEDPKDAILSLANENKEEMLNVLSAVVDTYRSGTLPDYYEAYPAKVAYPKLESVDEISLEKGDGDSDVNLFVKVDSQTLCVGLKYVEGSENPWMVVSTTFGGTKG